MEFKIEFEAVVETVAIKNMAVADFKSPCKLVGCEAIVKTERRNNKYADVDFDYEIDNWRNYVLLTAHRNLLRQSDYHYLAQVFAGYFHLISVRGDLSSADFYLA
jgi:hypothetical protein